MYVDVWTTGGTMEFGFETFAVVIVQTVLYMCAKFHNFSMYSSMDCHRRRRIETLMDAHHFVAWLLIIVLRHKCRKSI